MEQLSVKSGYDENEVEDFISVFHGVSGVSHYRPFDFTLTTFWGEAADKGGFSKRRYVLLKNGDPIGLFQGVVERKFLYRNMRSGSTSGNGMVVLPSYSKSEMRFFLREVLRCERFSDFSIFTPFSLGLPDLVEKPNYTFHISLELELDDIFRNMDKKTRNRVRKAEKSGVVVDFTVSLDALEKAYGVIDLASTERRFVPPSWSYTVRLHECFNRKANCSIVALSYGKNHEIISAAHLIGFDKKMILWQAGSTREGYRLNAGSLVQAEIIKWSKDHDYLIYDMGGTNPSDESFSGIHRFKSGFGGSLVPNMLLQRRAFYVPVAAKIYRTMRNIGLAARVGKFW